MDIERIVREHIDKSLHLSLATVHDNRPWVCELHFAYDHNLNLYFRSLTSRRHSQEIADNPNVAGNIVKQHTLDEYPTGIYFEGTAKLLQEGDEQNTAFMCIKERLQTSDGILEEAKQPNGHQFYKITVDTWYAFGKFDEEEGKKYKLEWNGGKEKGKP